MSLKVYIHLEEKGYAEQTSKIQVPKSWAEKQVRDVINLFLTAYNKKNAEQPVNVDEVHLATNDGEKLYSNDIVNKVFEEHGDYYIKFGAYVRAVEVKATQDPSMLRCKNYGCNQFYSDSDNHEESCRHHTGPPIFHDTMKCWSCCRDRKAYDFESFQLIEGCAVGRHSNEVQRVNIAPSPNSSDNVTGGEAKPVLKSIADFNTTNPTAASAAASAAQTIATRKSSRNADGITAKCQRKGCQKVFNIAENVGECCVYHKGQPVFHDAVKLWSCCPNVKCYDFDEFLAVKGCATGLHDDGEIDLTA